jgi:hypothetical protein
LALTVVLLGRVKAGSKLLQEESFYVHVAGSSHCLDIRIVRAGR